VSFIATKIIAAENVLELKAGVALLKFGYQEFTTDNSILDEESGMLPGIMLAATYHQPAWYSEMSFSYHQAKVDYSGHTRSDIAAQNNLLVSSRSDTAIADTTLIFGKPVWTQFQNRYEIYGGLGYYRWRRYILSSVTDAGLRVAGKLEFYSWFYAIAGIKVPLHETHSRSFNVDFRLTRMLQATLEVDHLGYKNWDKQTLDLGEKWGYQLRLPWHMILESKAVVTFEPYFTVWNIGRSNTLINTVGGVPTNTASTEPRSETRNFGLFVYYHYSI